MRTTENVKLTARYDRILLSVKLILRPEIKSFYGGNFSRNSTKTIRLFALDFYEAIVDSALVDSIVDSIFDSIVDSIVDSALSYINF